MGYFFAINAELIPASIGILALVAGGFVTLAIATFGRRGGDAGVPTLLVPLVPLYFLTFAEVVRAVTFVDVTFRPVAAWAEVVEAAARIVLAYGWVHACHRLLRLCGIVDIRQKATPVFAVLGAAAIALMAASHAKLLPFDVERIVSLEVGVSLTYAALSALFSFWRAPVILPSARVAVLLAAISMFIYPLVSLADVFGFSYPGMVPGVPVWMQTQPLYYAIVAAVMMVFVVRNLAPRAPAAAPVDLDAFDLTDRERETVSRLLRGESYKSISYSLGVSVATVKTHVNKAYAKLGVRSRSELQAGRTGASMRPSPLDGRPG